MVFDEHNLIVTAQVNGEMVVFMRPGTDALMVYPPGAESSMAESFGVFRPRKFVVSLVCVCVCLLCVHIIARLQSLNVLPSLPHVQLAALFCDVLSHRLILQSECRTDA